MSEDIWREDIWRDGKPKDTHEASPLAHKGISVSHLSQVLQPRDQCMYISKVFTERKRITKQQTFKTRMCLTDFFGDKIFIEKCKWEL